MNLRALVCISGMALLTVLSAACNKHSVPLGGECERIEDCGKGAFACLKTGGDKGYCTTTCSNPPPGTEVVNAKICEGSGMTCNKSAPAHPVLGTSYCTK